MINRYVILAAALIFAAVLCYFGYFFLFLGYKLSTAPQEWALFGDYLGGVLNPLLSFVSLVLLIKSLNLQNKANKSLRRELETTKKTERFRSFESHFFNMLSSQKLHFDSFKIVFLNGDETEEFRSVEAVLELEEQVERLISMHEPFTSVSSFLDDADSHDQIYGCVRMFYIMVKMISDKLSDENGFNSDDRKSHYLTLINFTDFALLRLILMAVQFMESSPSRYIKSHKEFLSILSELELSCELYKL